VRRRDGKGGCGPNPIPGSRLTTPVQGANQYGAADAVRSQIRATLASDPVVDAHQHATTPDRQSGPPLQLLPRSGVHRP
jgi:hypothetical protein